VGTTTADLGEVYSNVDTQTFVLVILFGAGWGCGSVTFGLGIEVVGASLGFAIILGLTAALGSVIPLVVLTPEDIATPAGYADFISLFLAAVGLALLGRAGMLREAGKAPRASFDGGEIIDGDGGNAHDMRFAGTRLLDDDNEDTWEYARPRHTLNAGSSGKGAAVAHADDALAGADTPKKPSFAVGLLICLVSGVLSPMLNLALAFGSDIADRAQTVGGASETMASNAVWAIAVLSGSIANIGYCSYLLSSKGSWWKFCARPNMDPEHEDEEADKANDGRGCCNMCKCLETRPGSPLVWIWPAAMGLAWFGGTALYGIGASLMGDLGKVLGWPVFITVMVLTGNVCGILAGEWEGAPRAAIMWLVAGLVTLVASAAVVGAGSAIH
jgi:L-rhamnose-H+ transport protein